METFVLLLVVLATLFEFFKLMQCHALLAHYGRLQMSKALLLSVYAACVIQALGLSYLLGWF